MVGGGLDKRTSWSDLVGVRQKRQSDNNTKGQKDKGTKEQKDKKDNLRTNGHNDM